ncbi:MAG: 3-phosphoshikimate 1-carboxyvinyltransferase [Bacteroidia bacterium]|nr:3-phosphoshikimate 1-carboxyvinyltransferase [Bacteroidia bacterium]
MKKKIFQGTISGLINAPPSKSYMQRTSVACMLADGKSVIKNPCFSDDCCAVINAIKNFGAKMLQKDDEVIITGGRTLHSTSINVGESGLAMRMLAPVAALNTQPVTITGMGSLLKRPVGLIKTTLNELGVNCSATNGFLPITVKGPIRGGLANVDGSESSQFLTGLLMALPIIDNDSFLHVKSLTSKPYIDMTIDLLKHFGIEIHNSNYEFFFISGRQKYHACKYTIEGDWSGAAFLLVAGAIGGEITVTGLNPDSKQADKKILEILKNSGAVIERAENHVKIIKNKLISFETDATDCPDLFPPLVVLAANCDGISEIHGTHRLLHKESNRATTLQKEFSALGIDISITDDKMLIRGGKIKGGIVDSHNDHRIAMAAAIASITAKEPVEILQAECVSKSYPGFFKDFDKIKV